MESIDLRETYVYGMSKEIIFKKEKIICNTKIFNFDYITKEDIKEQNPKWPKIPEHRYRILIIGGSASGKPNALLNLISNQSDIDKIYLYAKDSYKVKHQLLIKKRECIGLKYINDLKAFIEYSNDVDDIYKNIEKYNPNKKTKKINFI